MFGKKAEAQARPPAEQGKPGRSIGVLASIYHSRAAKTLMLGGGIVAALSSTIAKTENNQPVKMSRRELFNTFKKIGVASLAFSLLPGLVNAVEITKEEKKLGLVRGKTTLDEFRKKLKELKIQNVVEATQFLEESKKNPKIPPQFIITGDSLTGVYYFEGYIFNGPLMGIGVLSPKSDPKNWVIGTTPKYNGLFFAAENLYAYFQDKELPALAVLPLKTGSPLLFHSIDGIIAGEGGFHKPTVKVTTYKGVELFLLRAMNDAGELWKYVHAYKVSDGSYQGRAPVSTFVVMK